MRPRRSAEEARRTILDAAERRLREQGPASIRLQEIAADVGLSHPAILHHFGSREGLVRAVIDRALAALEADLVAALEAPANESLDPPALVERVFETLVDRGHARLVAWLVLSGAEGPPAREPRFLRRLAEAVDARRRARPRSRSARAAAGEAGRAGFESSLFAVLLTAGAAFGDALVGDALRTSAGLGHDGAAARRYRVWLAELLVAALAPAAAPGRRVDGPRRPRPRAER